MKVLGKYKGVIIIFASIGFIKSSFAHNLLYHPHHTNHHFSHGHHGSRDEIIALEGGITCGSLLASTCLEAARKTGADIEMLHDQVAEYLLSHQDSALLQEAMKKFQEELIKDNPEAANYSFDELIQHYLQQE